ncbi:MAG: methyltransferase domain-containing protein [Pseudonocardiaceae bacterium]|nr:methyltransferase domain-containing protein [Pseudonocardiaceae bacterium]
MCIRSTGRPGCGAGTRSKRATPPSARQRFTAMFDVLAELLPASLVALDLACGSGSISQRLLARVPGARAVAVDVDPVMLASATAHSAPSTVDSAGSTPTWPRPAGQTHSARSRWTRCSVPPHCTG